MYVDVLNMGVVLEILVHEGFYALGRAILAENDLMSRAKIADKGPAGRSSSSPYLLLRIWVVRRFHGQLSIRHQPGARNTELLPPLLGLLALYELFVISQGIPEPG
jgi:hypothetical protein